MILIFNKCTYNAICYKKKITFNTITGIYTRINSSNHHFQTCRLLNYSNTACYFPFSESTLPVINSDRFLGPEATSLTFVNLIKDDHMVIQCNASNIHGYVFANAYLGELFSCIFFLVLKYPVADFKIGKSRISD